MGLGITDPPWASEAATETLVRVGLKLRNTSVDLASRAFALNVATAIIAIKPERETTAPVATLTPIVTLG